MAVSLAAVAEASRSHAANFAQLQAQAARMQENATQVHEQMAKMEEVCPMASLMRCVSWQLSWLRLNPGSSHGVQLASDRRGTTKSSYCLIMNHCSSFLCFNRLSYIAYKVSIVVLVKCQLQFSLSNFNFIGSLISY